MIGCFRRVCRGVRFSQVTALNSLRHFRPSASTTWTMSITPTRTCCVSCSRLWASSVAQRRWTGRVCGRPSRWLARIFMRKPAAGDSASGQLRTNLSSGQLMRRARRAVPPTLVIVANPVVRALTTGRTTTLATDRGRVVDRAIGCILATDRDRRRLLARARKKVSSSASFRRTKKW